MGLILWKRSSGLFESGDTRLAGLAFLVSAVR